MADKFQNKYRIESNRLKNWDYGINALYFVTICTHNREHYFGDICLVQTPNLGVSTRDESTIKLSEIGKIAHKYWMEIPEHFAFVKLDAFIVMPNHVHGIIIINKKMDDCNDNTPKLGVSTIDHPNVQTPKMDHTIVETPKLGVSTNGGKNPKWKPATLGVIINQYKRICTINARKIHADFQWQPNYHDHIIRTDESFHRIQQYIINNPNNWDQDKFK